MPCDVAAGIGSAAVAGVVGLHHELRGNTGFGTRLDLPEPVRGQAVRQCMSQPEFGVTQMVHQTLFFGCRIRTGKLMFKIGNQGLGPKEECGDTDNTPSPWVTPGFKKFPRQTHTSGQRCTTTSSSPSKIRRPASIVISRYPWY